MNLGFKGGMKIYETILSQTEAEKLTADPVNSEVTGLIERAAEKEFEAQFKLVCHSVTEPIKVSKNAMNSPFLKKIVEKNQESIAFVTTCQTRINNNSQPKIEEQTAEPVKQKITGLGD